MFVKIPGKVECGRSLEVINLHMNRGGVGGARDPSEDTETVRASDTDAPGEDDAAPGVPRDAVLTTAIHEGTLHSSFTTFTGTVNASNRRGFRKDQH